MHFFIFNYWKISVNKIAPENILPIQRICQVLIYFNAILCIILVVKSFNIRGTKIYENEEESSILIETAFITLNSLYRSLLWLLAFLLSFGYNISLQNINNIKFEIHALLLYLSIKLSNKNNPTNYLCKIN